MTASDDIIAERLINLIKERPPLYNYLLPIQERNKIVRMKLWEEVASELQMPIIECQKRWKNLRDVFHSYRVNNPTKFAAWRYTERLKFIENIFVRKHKNKIEVNSDKLGCDDFKNANCTVLNEFDESHLTEDGYEHDPIMITPKIEFLEEFAMENNINAAGGCDDVNQKKRKLENDGQLQYHSNGNKLNQSKDELDLFLEFLNKKIRKLSQNDINEIQVKFLEIVIEKETNSSNSTDSNRRQ